jgi:MFS family permease
MSEASQVTADTPLFRVRNFRLLFSTRVASNTANQMQAVILGWFIYELTGSALALGMISLVQFLPPLLLTLPAGQFADRYDRRLIMRICYAVEAVVSASLLVLASHATETIMPAIYGLLLVNAVARTFEVPALTSLMPIMVPRVVLTRAVAAHASAGRMSMLLGPSVGGLIYTFGGTIAFAAGFVMVVVAFLSCLLLPPAPKPASKPKITWENLIGGLTFIRSQPSVLGAMSLDLLATLFGGAATILPIFARDILQTGPWGVGVLRSAPALGGLLTAALLARYPVKRSAGIVMFAGVTVYGVGTLLFGLSHWLGLSVLLFLLSGAGDMVAGVIRQSIIQLTTPDHYRGRVMAVHSLCVSTAGQLGGFESGVTAAWFGAPGSLIFGGFAVFLMVGLWAWKFPSLREVDRTDELQPAAVPA